MINKVSASSLNHLYKAEHLNVDKAALYSNLLEKRRHKGKFVEPSSCWRFTSTHRHTHTHTRERVIEIVSWSCCCCWSLTWWTACKHTHILSNTQANITEETHSLAQQNDGEACCRQTAQVGGACSDVGGACSRQTAEVFSTTLRLSCTKVVYSCVHTLIWK